MHKAYRVKLLEESEQLDPNEDRGESVKQPKLVRYLLEVLAEPG
jgi:hypothetical protein